MSSVAVLIPTWNRPDYLKVSLDSVLAQQGVDLEVVVLDNGSGPGTWEVLKSYTDPRILKLRQEVNNRRSAYSVMRGACAKTDYIVFFTDDDVMMPGNLEKKARYLDTHPEADYVCSAILTMDKFGNTSPTNTCNKGPADIDDAYPCGSIMVSCEPVMPAVLMRRTVPDLAVANIIDGAGGEWGLWLGVAGGKQGYLGAPLVALRQHDGAHTERALESGEFLDMYEKVWSYFMSRGLFEPTREQWNAMGSIWVHLVIRKHKGVTGSRWTQDMERFFRLQRVYDHGRC